jgi:predicted SAM-dependent methyltransferase
LIRNKKINIACGRVYCKETDWINLDFVGDVGVIRANLLQKLPFESNQANAVYSSHFIEHIPKPQVNSFLLECFRVLQPGGTIRLVVPDLEEMARSYLSFRDAGQHEKADFLVIELIDQCVRREAGGELGKLYKLLIDNNDDKHEHFINFIRHRTGESLLRENKIFSRQINKIFVSKMILRVYYQLSWLWIRFCLSGLPNAFRSQNVSLAAIGERHQWLWDYHQLKQALEFVGFKSVTRQSADRSDIKDFPFFDLDLNYNGMPRKGVGSMYIEATKPIEK